MQQGKNKNFNNPFSKSDLRKDMIATWGDTDSEDEEHDQTTKEIANLCLMTIDETDPTRRSNHLRQV